MAALLHDLRHDGGGRADLSLPRRLLPAAVQGARGAPRAAHALEVREAGRAPDPGRPAPQSPRLSRGPDLQQRRAPDHRREHPRRRRGRPAPSPPRDATRPRRPRGPALPGLRLVLRRLDRLGAGASHDGPDPVLRVPAMAVGEPGARRSRPRRSVGRSARRSGENPLPVADGGRRRAVLRRVLRLRLVGRDGQPLDLQARLHPQQPLDAPRRLEHLGAGDDLRVDAGVLLPGGGAALAHDLAGDPRPHRARPLLHPSAHRADPGQPAPGTAHERLAMVSRRQPRRC